MEKRDTQYHDFVDLESQERINKREIASEIEPESNIYTDLDESESGNDRYKRSDDYNLQEESQNNYEYLKKKRSNDYESYSPNSFDFGEENYHEIKKRQENQDDAPSSDDRRRSKKCKNLNESLNNLNTSINVILSLSNDDGDYVWNMINPIAQFILLNQSQILDLSFNINELLKQNVSYLRWSKLPDNVRTALLSQNIANLLSLTFKQWGWVGADSDASDLTLYDLLSAKSKILLPNLSTVLGRLDLSLKINEPPSSLNANFLDTFFKAFFRRDRQEKKQEKATNTKKIAKQVWLNASKFVKSLDL